MRRFDWSGYEGHVPELVAERDALRAIVEALPRCEELETDCKRIATHVFHGRYRCDGHATPYLEIELPYAEALRAWETSK